jgi:hypothetical protein
MKVKGMLLRRNGMHDVLGAAAVLRLVDARKGLQRSARSEQRGHYFLQHPSWDGLFCTTTSARRVCGDVRRGRAHDVHRGLLRATTEAATTCGA